jgi:hypothetical protein
LPLLGSSREMARVAGSWYRWGETSMYMYMHGSVDKSFCAVPGRLCLQEPMLKCAYMHLDVFVYKSICCTCTSLSTRAIVLSLVLSATACLQEPALYLNMCFRASSRCICLQEPVMYMFGSVDKSFCAVPGRLGNRDGL